MGLFVWPPILTGVRCAPLLDDGSQGGDPSRASTPRVWLLTAYRAGDNTQVLALGEALGWPFEQKRFVYVRWETLVNWPFSSTLAGVDIPGGAVMHMCLAAANRDPARWERPDEFDPGRPLQAQMGFGGGVHTCLGMHVARAEIVAAISMLLERFPNLRLDPDAPAPRITGMYERGPSAIPVLLT